MDSLRENCVSKIRNMTSNPEGICHVCLKELNEDNMHSEMLCNECAVKMDNRRYVVEVCEEHNVAQDITFSWIKKPKNKYTISKCNYPRQIKSFMDFFNKYLKQDEDDNIEEQLY